MSSTVALGRSLARLSSQPLTTTRTTMPTLYRETYAPRPASRLPRWLQRLWWWC